MNQNEFDPRVKFRVDTIAEQRPCAGLKGYDEDENENKYYQAHWIVIYPEAAAKTDVGETLEMYANAFPVGTLVKFYVPLCPECGIIAPLSFNLEDGHFCVCGKFNWFDWLNNRIEYKGDEND